MKATTTLKSHFCETTTPILMNEIGPPRKTRTTSPNTTADEDEIIAVAARLMYQLSRHNEEYDSSQESINHSRSTGNKQHSILRPSEEDVLSGRGAGVNHHPGNAYFRKLIQTQKLSYINANPPEKKKIIYAIVSTIRSKSGRFLKRDTSSGLWKCLTLDEAKKKTGQALREDAPKIKRMSISNECGGHSLVLSGQVPAGFVDTQELEQPDRIKITHREQYNNMGLGCNHHVKEEAHKPLLAAQRIPERNDQSLLKHCVTNHTNPSMTAPRLSFAPASPFLHRNPFSLHIHTSNVPFHHKFSNNSNETFPVYPPSTSLVQERLKREMQQDKGYTSSTILHQWHADVDVVERVRVGIRGNEGIGSDADSQKFKKSRHK